MIPTGDGYKPCVLVMSSKLLAGLASYENCLSQNCKKADEEKKVIGRRVGEIKSNRATGNDVKAGNEGG